MKSISIGVLALALSACASHSLSYNPPPFSTSTAEVSKALAKPYAAVWQSLIEGLAKRSYSIDSINKDSGLIVASKKLEPPSAYANCGHWDGYFKNMRVNERYDFQGADSANYMQKTGDIFTAVHRAAELNAKINIFVKKVDEKKTSISVNAVYTLKFDMQLSTYVYPQGQVNGRDVRMIEWPTSGRGKLPNGLTECVSSYLLEHSILELAERVQ